MREIALHLLDIAENSIEAGSHLIEITVEEDLPNDRLKIAIRDDGRGMVAEIVAQISDPFMTSRTTRKVGLGIPLFKAAAEACNGQLHIVSSPNQGTSLEVEFQRSHIDRMPLGDLAGTMLTLVVAHPQIQWLFHYRGAGEAFTFDSQPIMEELGDFPLTEPSILAFIREMLQEGVARVRRAIDEKESQSI